MPAKRPAKPKTKVSKPLKPAAKPAASGAKRPAPSTTVSATPDAGAVRAHPAAAGAPAKGAGAAGRAQRWAQVSARDIMRERFVTVDYSAPLSEVERVLSENRLLGVPVVDEAGQIM